MNLYEFNLLSEVEKLDKISRYATEVATRNDSFYRFDLYQLDCFYVEIKTSLHNGYCESNRSFSAEKLPDSYLEQIDISELV